MFLAADLDEELTKDGVQDVVEYLGGIDPACRNLVMWYIGSWELVTDEGRLVKRIAKLLHRFGYKLSDIQLTQLGTSSVGTAPRKHRWRMTSTEP